MDIPGLRGLRPGKTLLASLKEFSSDDMTTYAAALAYQGLLSLFPFLVFVIALISTLHLPDFVAWLRSQAQFVVPQEVMGQINGTLDRLVRPQGGLLSVGAVIALWTASTGVRSLMNALNAAYGVEEGRPAWKLYPLSILYTVALAAILLLAVAFMLLGPQVMQWLARQVGLADEFVLVWAWLRIPVAVVLMILAAAIVYYTAPDAPKRFRLITPGAVLAVLVWVIASFAFSYYVSNFSNYDAMYGSIGAIVVVLLYFYITAAVFLLGAELNAVIEREVPEGKEEAENAPNLRKKAAARAV